MTRRVTRLSKPNPHHAARFRQETERRRERESLMIVWASLAVFDLVLLGYSATHFVMTGHREVFVTIMVSLLVTASAVWFLPLPQKVQTKRGKRIEERLKRHQ